MATGSHSPRRSCPISRVHHRFCTRPTRAEAAGRLPSTSPRPTCIIWRAAWSSSTLRRSGTMSAALGAFISRLAVTYHPTACEWRPVYRSTRWQSQVAHTWRCGTSPSLQRLYTWVARVRAPHRTSTTCASIHYSSSTHLLQSERSATAASHIRRRWHARRQLIPATTLCSIAPFLAPRATR